MYAKSIFSVALLSVVAPVNGLLGGLITNVDVAIIGGGPAGSHAAFRLTEDYKKKVVIIEQASRLGGHTGTYDDPNTGKSTEYGVSSYNMIPGTAEFFARFGINMVAGARASNTVKYSDFTTGKAVAYTGPTDTMACLQKYVNLYNQYKNILEPGIQNMPKNGNVPDVLLKPVSEVAAQYGFSNALPTIFGVTCMGTGDIMNTQMLTLFRAFNGDLASSFLGGAATLVPSSGRNMELYEKIAAKLGSSNIMYDTQVVTAIRTSIGVTLIVRDGSGWIKVINAKRLLITAAPSLSNYAALGLTLSEFLTISKFTYSKVFCGLISHPLLVDGTTYQNTPGAAANGRFLEFPKLPFTQRLESRGDGLFRFTAIGGPDTTATEIKAYLQKSFDNLVKTGVVSGTTRVPIKFPAFNEHGAMHFKAAPSDVKAGFYDAVNAMQGTRRTWFAGAQWAQPFSSSVWKFNEEVILPALTNGL